MKRMLTKEKERINPNERNRLLAHTRTTKNHENKLPNRITFFPAPRADLKTESFGFFASPEESGRWRVEVGEGGNVGLLSQKSVVMVARSMEIPKPSRVRLSSASELEVKGLNRFMDFFRVVVVAVVAVVILLALDTVRRGVKSGEGGNGGGGKGSEVEGVGE